MNVLMVLTYYYPHWTGLTNNARWMAEGLASRGHRVTVLTARYDRELPGEEMVNGVRVVRLSAMPRISRGVLMPGFPARLWRLLRENDIVQMHTPLLEAPLVALLARMLHRPVIFTHHGDLVMPGGFFNRVVERIVTLGMSLALSLSDWVTILNHDYARHSVFLRPAAHKLSCIYPPINIPNPDAHAAEAWKTELGLADRPVVGFAGRWVEEKGFDYLLQAIPHILKTLPGTHFLYAGETKIAYEDFFTRCHALLEPVRDRVTLLGLITDRQKLADFYKMCDVFVLPSRTDCLAVVQTEAMFCGTPVVASDIPGAREPVQVTGMGRLAPAGDVAGLSEAIVGVLHNPQVYARPRETLENIFCSSSSLNQYEQLMSALSQRDHNTALILSTIEVSRESRKAEAAGCD
jgi:glycosyltransferase involved in cell wall biosynthesis